MIPKDLNVQEIEKRQNALLKALIYSLAELYCGSWRGSASDSLRFLYVTLATLVREKIRNFIALGKDTEVRQ